MTLLPGEEDAIAENVFRRLHLPPPSCYTISQREEEFRLWKPQQQKQALQNQIMQMEQHLLSLEYQQAQWQAMKNRLKRVILSAAKNDTFEPVFHGRPNNSNNNTNKLTWRNQ